MHNFTCKFYTFFMCRINFDKSKNFSSHQLKPKTDCLNNKILPFVATFSVCVRHSATLTDCSSRRIALNMKSEWRRRRWWWLSGVIQAISGTPPHSTLCRARTARIYGVKRFHKHVVSGDFFARFLYLFTGERVSDDVKIGVAVGCIERDF